MDAALVERLLLTKSYNYFLKGDLMMIRGVL
jgi:hypothetical protein